MRSRTDPNTRLVATVVLGVFSACFPQIGAAQDLDPRRWDHLPVDVSFAGTAFVYTDGEIAFDPVLLIDDAVMTRRTFAFKYLRSFELLGRSARIELLQAYQNAKWSGLLAGVPASVERSGWADTEARFSVNLIGAPPLRAEEFARYRASTKSETIVGMGLVVQFPTGKYLEDKLLNIGTNRFTFRPQIGVLHRQGKLSVDVTVSSWLYTDNHEFIVNNTLEQDPLHVVQAHGVYNLTRRVWAGAGVGYGAGKESKINGVPRNNREEILGWELSAGLSITRNWGVKLKYVGLRKQRFVGSDTDSVFLSTTVFW